MRKRLTLAVAMAVGVAAIGGSYSPAAQSPTLQGADGNTQSIAVNLTPSKRSATKPAPITLEVVTATDNATTANGVPVPAVQAIIDFPKGLSIFSKGFPTCDASKLQSTSSEVALQQCKKAKIGTGVGTADLVVGSRVFPVTTTITVFNGKPQGGKPVILLHTYAQQPVQTTLVLVGVVKKYNKQGFGARLDVSIPLIAGGQGAITGVKIKVFKKFRYKGKVRSYVSATCPTKTWKARGKFVFRDGESLTPQLKAKCTPKK
jgi:hypothetical protein